MGTGFGGASSVDSTSMGDVGSNGKWFIILDSAVDRLEDVLTC